LPGSAGPFLLSWSLNTNIVQFPTITQHPADATVNPGGFASFSVQVTNVSNPGYQWYFDRSYAVPGGTNATLTIPNVRAFPGSGFTAWK